MTGETSALVLDVEASGVIAALGEVWTKVVVVRHGGLVPVRVVVHPAGNDGAATPSKSSVNVITLWPMARLAMTDPRSRPPSSSWKVALIVPPQTLFAVKPKLPATEPPAATAPRACEPDGASTPPPARNVAIRLVARAA